MENFLNSIYCIYKESLVHKNFSYVIPEFQRIMAQKYFVNT